MATVRQPGGGCRPIEAALLLVDAAMFTHERVVSVNLACKSRPSTSEIFQNLGFSLILRQFHQATAFCRLIEAVLCTVHGRGNGLTLCKFDGRDGPLPIVAPDRNSQPVMLVKPNLLRRPRLSIGEDYGLAYKLSLGLVERAEDR